MNYKLLLLDTHAKNLYPLGDDFSGKSPQGTTLSAVSYTHLTLPTICSV